jgi:hypothetical protein
MSYINVRAVCLPRALIENKMQFKPVPCAITSLFSWQMRIQNNIT